MGQDDFNFFNMGNHHPFMSKNRIKVSQWAEQYRMVTDGDKEGPWLNSNTPYLVEPMDCWNDPWVRKIILCFAPQTGKTQVAFNTLCYSIDQDPGPAMYIMPDEKTAKRISTQRLIPTFKGTPKIARLMGNSSYDTKALGVNFQNGMNVMMAWSTSASELSSESVRYIFFDETDKYPRYTGKEADPISLGEVRTNTYPYNKKIMYLSTPTTEEGVISKAVKYEADEVRDYFVPCKECKQFQIMEFENIKWSKDIRDSRMMMAKKEATYQCVNCGDSWDDNDRMEAVQKGRWQPRQETERPGAVAFHLPSWYSPFVDFYEVAAAFLKGKEEFAKFMAFKTQHEAVPWKSDVRSKTEKQILACKTNILPGIIPGEARELTCGIDPQQHGFWFVVRAWEKNMTSWLIDYGFLSTFHDLKTLVFDKEYRVQGTKKTKKIWRAAIDTGGGKDSEGRGSKTEEIYHWLRKYHSPYSGKIFGIKGASHNMNVKMKQTTVAKKPYSSRGGLPIRLLNTSLLKDELHDSIDQRDVKRFYLHADTELTYVHQILAEEKIKDRKGNKKWTQKKRDNHLLDCEVYALACVSEEWRPSLRETIEVQDMPPREVPPPPLPRIRRW